MEEQTGAEEFLPNESYKTQISSNILKHNSLNGSGQNTSTIRVPSTARVGQKNPRVNTDQFLHINTNCLKIYTKTFYFKTIQTATSSFIIYIKKGILILILFIVSIPFE